MACRGRIGKCEAIPRAAYPNMSTIVLLGPIVMFPWFGSKFLVKKLNVWASLGMECRMVMMDDRQIGDAESQAIARIAFTSTSTIVSHGPILTLVWFESKFFGQESKLGTLIGDAMMDGDGGAS